MRILLLLLLLPTAALAAPATVSEALVECSAVYRWGLPTLDAEQLEKLDAGKVVRIREIPDDPEQPQRVVGLVRSPVPRVHLWLAALLPEFDTLEEFVDVRLNPGVYPARWYELLTLPWPLRPRHWIIDTGDTTTAAAATADRCWEHYWDLVPMTQEQLRVVGLQAGIDADKLDKSVIPPVNHGAWVAITLPGGDTLFGYHVTAIVGGRIPEDLVTGYAMATLRKMVKDVEKRAPQAAQLYGVQRAEFEPLPGGDGKPLPAVR